MHNSKYQCHMAYAAHTTDQLTSPSCLTVATHKKAYLLTKNTEEFFLKKFRRMGQQEKKRIRQKE